ncbi:unnamed protein product [Adineta steineri]|uniref:Uncharacterized protein n=1 Tax=Adineta steineri TaxID=433720 RepID=A0A818S2Y5_9BILA|nr:unnamed protein product [Adineta steineri]CAF3657528.1 unnamed protein product [Adineta steineri]
MVRLSLFTCLVFIGLSMVIAKNEVKFRHNNQKRLSRNNEQFRGLRSLIGELIDTEANAIYNLDGQKKQFLPLNSDESSTMASSAPIHLPKQSEMACLAACHTCLEGQSIVSRKKKDDDDNNCGPMCDCADSCFYMPVEQVKSIYGPISSVRNGKDCWSRTYHEILNSGK